MDRETIVFEYRMNGMSEGDAEIHADIYFSELDKLENLRAENERLTAENERLRAAFTKPDHEILAKVCYGVNCYPDELADMLETYWEALK